MKKSELKEIIKEEVLKVLTEFNWPQSKLSQKFVSILKPELDKEFKGHMIYGKGMDIYVDNKKMLTVNGDVDSVSMIVKKLKNKIK